MFEAVSILTTVARVVSERARVVHSNANRFIFIYLPPLHAVVGTLEALPPPFLVHTIHLLTNQKHWQPTLLR